MAKTSSSNDTTRGSADTPQIVASVEQDDSEDEVFFGEKSAKEVQRNK